MCHLERWGIFETIKSWLPFASWSFHQVIPLFSHFATSHGEKSGGTFNSSLEMPSRRSPTAFSIFSTFYCCRRQSGRCYLTTSATTEGSPFFKFPVTFSLRSFKPSLNDVLKVQNSVSRGHLKLLLTFSSKPYGLLPKTLPHLGFCYSSTHLQEPKSVLVTYYFRTNYSRT